MKIAAFPQAEMLQPVTAAASGFRPDLRGTAAGPWKPLRGLRYARGESLRPQPMLSPPGDQGDFHAI